MATMTTAPKLSRVVTHSEWIEARKQLFHVCLVLPGLVQVQLVLHANPVRLRCLPLEPPQEPLAREHVPLQHLVEGAVAKLDRAVARPFSQLKD